MQGPLITYRHRDCFAHSPAQMFVKTVNIEGIFNFTFGTGKDENLIVNLTEFVDSKAYAGGDSRDHSSSSGSHAQQGTTAQA